MGFILQTVRDLFLSFWLKRATLRRVRRVVKALDARRGTVISDRRYGGLLLAPGRGIVAIRRGDEDAVIEELFGAAIRAGYRKHRVVPNGQKRSLAFDQPPGLPHLWIELFAAGTCFRSDSTRPIPEGHTGVVFSFG